MIRRIHLLNFMSHKDTTIELADGLTVLIGPNNCGKSAVVEALRVLCENDGSEVMVRHGETLCRITVEVEDGTKLVWQRDGKTVSYEVAGRPVGRLKRSVPEDLHQHLRLPLVEIPGKDRKDWINLHFGEQKSPIFLLNNSGAEIAGFFSASSDAAKLLEMQQLHKDQVREGRRDLKIQTEELAALEARVASLTALDAIAPQLETAEAQYAQLREGDQAVSTLAGMIDRIEAKAGVIGHHSRQCQALADLAATPQLHDVTPLVSLTGHLGRVMAEQLHRAMQTEAAAGLQSPPELKERKPLVDLGTALAKTSKEHAYAAALAGAAAAMVEMPRPADAAPLEIRVEQMARSATAHSAARQQDAAMDRELADLRRQIAAWVEINPNCPLCGAAVSVDSMFSGESTPGAPQIGEHIHA